MLAINGGSPVWARGWPKWPVANQQSISGVLDVLESGRWAISGPSLGIASRELSFSQAFADYCGVRYCVPTSSGSAALLIALEALNIGVNDEVLVPVLTWVATASAVTNANAIPIFVDIDPVTLCISPEDIRAAVTSQTAAIIPVHLFAGMADMDTILDIARQEDLAVIEDASHVHGARWRNSPAGSLGDIGTFSMQQTKVLTSGEGGATITNDATLFRRLEQLRSDSRIRVMGVSAGEMDLQECGEIQGTNHCLSEFQAELLLANLKLLDQQHQTRERNAVMLDSLLSEIEGVMPIPCDSRVNKRVYYRYVVRIIPEAFASCSIEVLSKALSLELGLEVLPLYRPLHRNPLYNPLSKRRFELGPEYLRKLDVSAMHFPNAEAAYATCMAIPHPALLGNSDHMQAIAEAFRKVKRFAAQL